MVRRIGPGTMKSVRAPKVEVGTKVTGTLGQWKVRNSDSEEGCGLPRCKAAMIARVGGFCGVGVLQTNKS